MQWFNGVFLKYVREKNIKGQKVLFLDGHTSHISIELLECAIENEVTLLKLPPHTSSFLQPCDVSVFKPLKTAWRKHFREVYYKIIYFLTI
jgi:hypothetical protein